MINEEKVKLMTKAAIFEQKEKKKSLQTTSFFQYDYISLELIKGWFFSSVVYVILAAFWVVCNMEELLDNLHKMDLKAFGMKAVLAYVAVVLIYLCILYVLYSYRYFMAKRRVNTYTHMLNSISNIYKGEEKEEKADVSMEEIRHD